MEVKRDRLGEKYQHLFRVIFVGARGSGKSQLLNVLAEINFMDTYKPTIGEDFAHAQWKTSQVSALLNFWDTPGDATSYYSAGHVYLVLYARNDRKSFEAVEEILQRIFRRFHSLSKCILVANKTDLEEEKVQSIEGRMLATSKGIPYVEVSAKNSQGLPRLMKLIMQTAHEEFWKEGG